MVKVIINQPIRGAKGESATMELEYESEFPPTRGMGIKVSPATMNIVLGAVQYVISTKSYVGYAEHLILEPKEDFIQVASEFQRAGYRRVK